MMQIDLFFLFAQKDFFLFTNLQRRLILLVILGKRYLVLWKTIRYCESIKISDLAALIKIMMILCWVNFYFLALFFWPGKWRSISIKSTWADPDYFLFRKGGALQLLNIWSFEILDIKTLCFLSMDPTS